MSTPSVEIESPLISNNVKIDIWNIINKLRTD